MISKIFWIGILMAMCSVRSKSSIGYSIRKSRSRSSTTPFDISKIRRLNQEICLDLGLFVSQTIASEAIRQNVNAATFLNDVILEMKKMFLWHNIKLQVSEFEIFTVDPFSHSNTNHEDLIALSTYLDNRNSRNDVNMYLKDYTNPTQDQIGGYAFVNTACSRDAVGTLNINFRNDDFNVKMAAALMAHEIGHQLGFTHSDSAQPGCECSFPNVYCLGPTFQFNADSNIPKSFENCLIDKFQNNLVSFSCLQTCNNISETNFCGDGVVNGNERCDCGFGELCHLLGNRCCNPDTCNYRKSDFQCDEGECCEDCKFSQYNVCSNNIDGQGTKGVCTGLDNKCVAETQTITTKIPIYPTGNLDQMCVKYFGTGNFYSERCYQNIEKYITYYCSKYHPGSEFYDGECKDRSSICNNLVCEGSQLETTDTINSVNYGGYYCNYYKTSHGIKNFGAHTGVQCGANNKKECSKGKCVFRRKSRFNKTGSNGSRINSVSLESMD